MDHSDVMGMIKSPSSWEQVIYDVIAFEGLDPWDLDLAKLANSFLKHVQDLQEMDFKVPAKYVMVVSTLLRMKSDHLPFIDYFNGDEDNGEVEETSEVIQLTEEPALNPLTIPPRRLPRRKIVVSELVTALRKVLGTADKRDKRVEHARKKIKIHHDDIGKRISALYDRINSILTRAKGEEVRFSNLVPSGKKPDVANTFLPLVYLDHQKKVECRQEEIFDEIYIKRAESPKPKVKGKRKHKSVKD